MRIWDKGECECECVAYIFIILYGYMYFGCGREQRAMPLDECRMEKQQAENLGRRIKCFCELATRA